MKRALSILTLTLLAVGCGSVGLPDLGDILGSSGSNDRSDVRGHVVRVDTGAQRIDLDVRYVNNLRDDNTADTAVYYDSRTTVEFQGQTYRPQDLERGDEVAIVGANVNGRFVADRITVVRDVSGR